MRARTTTDSSRLTNGVLTLAVLALLAFTLQTLVFSGANFLSSSQNPGNALLAGTVSHTNDRKDLAILTANNLRPGASSAPGLVTITGGPDVPAAYSAVKGTVADSEPPGLSNALNLLIEDVTLPGSPQQLYNGTVSGFTTVPLVTIAPGEARVFRFTLVWPLATADPALQGDSTTVAVQFVGVSL